MQYDTREAEAALNDTNRRLSRSLVLPQLPLCIGCWDMQPGLQAVGSGTRVSGNIPNWKGLQPKLLLWLEVGISCAISGAPQTVT